MNVMYVLQEPTTYVRKKREYKKRKHKLPPPEQKPLLHPVPQMPNYPSYPDLSTLPRDVVSTDDDGAFSVSIEERRCIGLFVSIQCLDSWV